ncbi:MAG: hypothetical protein J4215_00975 [Candidatus Diapherotrites archaeon]|uniref:N-acetyltransferase domain-containing protein n=1 Tax=Candidatus Iainarchaeum sp. TaxID=3101447 RepID=A0A8T4LE10_9ARCH|nr:hypothetical protein [Candidatus Diapherotrites archaeon]
MLSKSAIRIVPKEELTARQELGLDELMEQFHSELKARKPLIPAQTACLVGLVNNEPVGFVSFGVNSKELKVWAAYLRPGYRNTGALQGFKIAIVRKLASQGETFHKVRWTRATNRQRVPQRNSNVYCFSRLPSGMQEKTLPPRRKQPRSHP